MPVISTIAAATARAFGAFKSLGGAADEFFNYVTLLLHGDGTNGAQNNTFLDSSTNNFTITRNGNTTQGTFSPFSQTGWSNYFDGSGDYLSLAANAALNVGTGDFTWEAWALLPNNTSDYSLFSGTSTADMDIRRLSDGTLRIGRINTAWDSTSSVISIANSWTHLAISRSGSTLRMYANGTQIFSGTNTNNYSIATTAQIGLTGASDGQLLGYLSNARLVKGTAVYTSAFTPSTTPLTAISGTSLLTCQSNRFRDASSNNFAITVNGNTSVQAFSPFAPTAAYSAATVGGSGYFDGSGDYLTYTYGSEVAFGTGDFTVEWWQYSTDTGSGILQGDSGAGWGATILSGTFYWQSVVNVTNKLTASVSAYLTDSWNHWAVVRSSGTLKLYINGAEIASVSDTTNYSDSSGTMYVGYYPNNGNYFLGYLSNLRIVKGTAVYTSAFTPPTAPLTAISGTSLLLNFTNAGIIDNTAKNLLETVGNAQISTSVKKYGTGSLAFDGTGDYLVVPYSQNQNFGTGDFTIEGWFYLNSLANSYYVLGGTWTSGTSDEWLIQVQNNGNIRFLTSAGTSFYSASITTSTWYHFAAVRNGSTVTLYINGSSVGSYSNSNSIGSVSKVLNIGQQPGGSWPWNGYIDDLRITKGVARYTATFTAPTAAFADQ